MVSPHCRASESYRTCFYSGLREKKCVSNGPQTFLGTNCVYRAHLNVIPTSCSLACIYSHNYAEEMLLGAVSLHPLTRKLPRPASLPFYFTMYIIGILIVALNCLRATIIRNQGFLVKTYLSLGFLSGSSYWILL